VILGSLNITRWTWQKAWNGRLRENPHFLWDINTVSRECYAQDCLDMIGFPRLPSNFYRPDRKADLLPRKFGRPALLPVMIGVKFQATLSAILTNRSSASDHGIILSVLNLLFPSVRAISHDPSPRAKACPVSYLHHTTCRSLYAINPSCTFPNTHQRTKFQVQNRNAKKKQKPRVSTKKKNTSFPSSSHA
jgi:hypothetical protein